MGIGATIPPRQEVQCLLYAGFFTSEIYAGAKKTYLPGLKKSKAMTFMFKSLKHPLSFCKL